MATALVRIVLLAILLPCSVHATAWTNAWCESWTNGSIWTTYRVAWDLDAATRERCKATGVPESGLKTLGIWPTWEWLSQIDWYLRVCLVSNFVDQTQADGESFAGWFATHHPSDWGGLVLNPPVNDYKYRTLYFPHWTWTNLSDHLAYTNDGYVFTHRDYPSTNTITIWPQLSDLMQRRKVLEHQIWTEFGDYETQPRCRGYAIIYTRVEDPANWAAVKAAAEADWNFWDGVTYPVPPWILEGGGWHGLLSTPPFGAYLAYSVTELERFAPGGGDYYYQARWERAATILESDCRTLFFSCQNDYYAWCRTNDAAVPANVGLGEMAAHDDGGTILDSGRNYDAYNRLVHNTHDWFGDEATIPTSVTTGHEKFVTVVKTSGVDMAYAYIGNTNTTFQAWPASDPITTGKVISEEARGYGVHSVPWDYVQGTVVADKFFPILQRWDVEDGFRYLEQ